jgi:hypothetical protein
MNNPDTAKTWKTAFGKVFGGTAHGDNKWDKREHIPFLS